MDVCRVCLMPAENYTDIFEYNTSQRLVINQMMELVASVQIKHDDFRPNKICKSCLSDLERSFSFRKRLLESDNVLNNNNPSDKLELCNKNIRDLATLKSKYVQFEVVKLEPCNMNIETLAPNVISQSDEKDSLQLNSNQMDLYSKQFSHFKIFNKNDQIEVINVTNTEYSNNFISNNSSQRKTTEPIVANRCFFETNRTNIVSRNLERNKDSNVMKIDSQHKCSTCNLILPRKIDLDRHQTTHVKTSKSRKHLPKKRFTELYK